MNSYTYRRYVLIVLIVVLCRDESGTPGRNRPCFILCVSCPPSPPPPPPPDARVYGHTTTAMHEIEHCSCFVLVASWCLLHQTGAEKTKRAFDFVPVAGWRLLPGSGWHLVGIGRTMIGSFSDGRKPRDMLPRNVPRQAPINVCGLLLA